MEGTFDGPSGCLTIHCRLYSSLWVCDHHSLGYLEVPSTIDLLDVCGQLFQMILVIFVLPMVSGALVSEPEESSPSIFLPLNSGECLFVLFISYKDSRAVNNLLHASNRVFVELLAFDADGRVSAGVRLSLTLFDEPLCLAPPKHPALTMFWSLR